MKYFASEEISKKSIYGKTSSILLNHKTIIDIGQIDAGHIIKKTASTEAVLNHFRTDNKWFLQDNLES